MKTSPAICFDQFEMKPDYLEDFTPAAGFWFPLDFGAIDAPDIISAGSVKSVPSLARPGQFLALQRTISRP